MNFAKFLKTPFITEHLGWLPRPIVLRILTGKKDRQIKLQQLRKVQIWAFELLVQQIIPL